MANIYTLAELQNLVNRNLQHWRPIVFTNGCFDLLHVGHVRYLDAAKQLGKSLVVGINSDRSVQQLKGNQRPIIPDSQRAEIIGALKSVDGVVIFGETTASRLIEVLQPEIYVKGGDYQPENLPEAPTVLNYGGKIELIQVEIPTSTSKIIQKIVDTYSVP
jgi:D-glycero-beta-D-manno-heptose 1-phosphate adenylyltransferase